MTMTEPGRPTRLAALLLAGCLLTGGAAAQTATDLLAEGNRLFHDDLYWAALLRYEQAAEAGLDTPLLHYNTGVAHYRAGQYVRAQTAFRRALAAAEFAAHAQYNLGLAAMAAGDRDGARESFLAVQSRADKPRLAGLAARALQVLDAPAAVPQRDDAAPEDEALNRRGLDLRISAGIGTDDNVFRAPGQPYNDRAQPGTPAVTPDAQSGTFVPLDLRARYSVGSFDYESFYASYRLDARLYSDTALENANEYTQQLAFGSEYHRRVGERERKIESAFTIARHDETWFDPDDGSERLVDGELAGERLSYVRYGPELYARQSWERLSFNLNAKGQIWNYDSVPDLPDFDHEYLRLGLSAQYRFTSTSLVRIEADGWTRRFGERRAYDLNGDQSLASPSLRYDYLRLGAAARQRVTRKFWFGVRYARTERLDKHLGYNDYLLDSYGAEVSLRVGERFKLRAQGWYRNYNYVRAFAYNDRPSGRRTYESVDGRLVGRWQWRDDLHFVGEFHFRDRASNDLRIDYTRSQFMLGVRWYL